MMKRYILISICILSFIAAKSQVRDSRVQIDTTIYPAVTFDADLSDNDAKDAIESYFDSMHIEKEKGKGFIIKKSLGYMLFRRAKVDYSNDMLDYYFVVDSRKGKNASNISIAISRNGNFFSPENDKATWDNLKTFASYLVSNYFDQYKLNTQLADANKDMDKKMKKLADVLKEKADLETGISQDSSKIADLQQQLIILKQKKQ